MESVPVAVPAAMEQVKEENVVVEKEDGRVVELASVANGL